MKVILTTNIKKLGKIGDLVDVKNGYARNFLFPNNMALRDSKKNLEYYNNIKEEIKNKEDKKLEEAKNIIEKIKNLNQEVEMIIKILLLKIVKSFAHSVKKTHP